MANVADTILEQLGGNKFRAMTGAKNFLSYGPENALSFRLPANLSKDKINYVKITLGSNDLYTVDFKYIRGVKVTDISKHYAVCCDELQELFTEATSLATHL